METNLVTGQAIGNPSLAANQLPVFDSRTAIPAWYVVPVAAITGNGQQPASLTTDGDSVFRLVRFQGTSDQDAKGDISPNNFSVQISLQTGRLLTSPQTASVPQRIICPTQMFVIDLPIWVDLPEKTVLQFNFTDLSGATNNVTFCLVGYKMFRNFA